MVWLYSVQVECALVYCELSAISFYCSALWARAEDVFPTIVFSSRSVSHLSQLDWRPWLSWTLRTRVSIRQYHALVWRSSEYSRIPASKGCPAKCATHAYSIDVDSYVFVFLFSVPWLVNFLVDLLIPFVLVFLAILLVLYWTVGCAIWSDFLTVPNPCHRLCSLKPLHRFNF